MHKTWTVIQHEFQVMTSRLAYRIFAGIVPVVALLGLVGIVVFQAVQTEEPPEDVQAGYVDMTAGTDGGPLFTDYRTQGLTEFVPYEDVETATTALLEGDIRQLFVISEDYLETGVVEEVRLGSGGLPSPGGIGNSSSSPLGRFLLSNLFADADPQRAERAIAPVQVQVREIDETGAPVTEGPDFSMLAFYLIVAILLMVSVFMTSGYLLQGLNDEKENRIMEVLLSSVRPEQLLIGKLFGLGAAGLLQMFIWAASLAAFVFALGFIVDVPEGLIMLPSWGAIVVAFLYFILGYFFFGALMAALGAVTTSQREANQVTFLIVLPGVAPLWFLQVLLENPEGTLARVLSFVPFTAPVVSLTRLGLESMSWLNVALSLLVLAGFVALAMWFTARLFHAFLLMYGQRPSLRQVLRTLGGA